MRLFKEEIFGPILSVAKADSLEHAIELQNTCDFGLSSSIYTRNVNAAFQAIRDIEAGITYVNSRQSSRSSHAIWWSERNWKRTPRRWLDSIRYFH
jgi:aldehyde dehydrogenase (NAD+)